jgi:hypothetical protein
MAILNMEMLQKLDHEVENVMSTLLTFASMGLRMIKFDDCMLLFYEFQQSTEGENDIQKKI